MRLMVAALLPAAVLACAQAFAQSPQTSDEIVDFFTGPGGSRGVCIGTEEECRNRPEAPLRAGLDMLIHFELDSAELSADAQARLGEFARALRDSRLRPRNFVVEGHTDALGTAEYNLQLSERRANAVVSFLVANGVEPSRISAVGKGMSEPRVEDPLDPVNRRVEMRLAEEQLP